MRSDQRSIVDQRTGSEAIGALAVGAVAFGAAAIGALAVGVMSIRRLKILEARIESFSIGTLTVDHLNVTSDMRQLEVGDNARVLTVDLPARLNRTEVASEPLFAERRHTESSVAEG